MKIIRFAQHQKMKWKNGLGESSQIAIFPEGAQLSNFLWRLSSAHIMRSSAFSIYEGYERLLCITKGPGLRLKYQNGRDEFINKHQVIRFRGEEQIFCEVEDQEIFDIGFVFERTKIDATMKLEKLATRNGIKVHHI